MINPRSTVFFALSLIVIGLLLFIQENKSQVERHEIGNTSVNVVKINTQEHPEVFRYLGVGCILLGLVLAAMNLNIRGHDNEKIEIKFTKREKEIVDAVKRGLTNKEIAQEMNLSLSTIKSHTNNIYKKVGINSRAKLIDYLKSKY